MWLSCKIRDEKAPVPSEGDKISGKVLAVSRSSILIYSNEGELFTVLNGNNGCGPNYIILDSEDDLRDSGILPGQEVILISRGIYSPGDCHAVLFIMRDCWIKSVKQIIQMS